MRHLLLARPRAPRPGGPRSFRSPVCNNGLETQKDPGAASPGSSAKQNSPHDFRVGGPISQCGCFLDHLRSSARHAEDLRRGAPGGSPRALYGPGGGVVRGRSRRRGPSRCRGPRDGDRRRARLHRLGRPSRGAQGGPCARPPCGGRHLLLPRARPVRRALDRGGPRGAGPGGGGRLGAVPGAPAGRHGGLLHGRLGGPAARGALRSGRRGARGGGRGGRRGQGRGCGHGGGYGHGPGDGRRRTAGGRVGRGGRGRTGPAGSRGSRRTRATAGPTPSRP